MQIGNGSALQYRSGDIILGVLIAQHVEAQGYTCGGIEPYGPQLMETVNMLVESVGVHVSMSRPVVLVLQVDVLTYET